MLAFKGFTKDLTCIRGKGIFPYEPGVLYTADKSKCASTGFHCTENPLECLDWYVLGEGNGRWEKSRIKKKFSFIVLLENGRSVDYAEVAMQRR